MDLQNEHSVEKLKALAYDKLALQQQIQAELSAINQRIAELQEAPKDKDKSVK